MSEYSLTGTSITFKTVCNCMINKGVTVSDVLFVKAMPILEDTKYTVMFMSVALNLKMPIPVSQHHTWTELININNLKKKEFDVVLSEEETPAFAFAPLFHDTDLTDFELSITKLMDGQTTGSVNVHKAVLAACSPVFHRMFSGQWKETSKGQMKLPVDQSALVAFKKYIYTHNLTENLDQLKQLHLISTYYMMPELKERSMDSLARQATGTTAYDILQFAFDNHCRDLALVVFKRLCENVINVKDITFTD